MSSGSPSAPGPLAALGERRSATRGGFRRGVAMDSAALERDAVQFARRAVQRDQEGRYAEAVFTTRWAGGGAGAGGRAGGGAEAPARRGLGPRGGGVPGSTLIGGDGRAGRSAPQTCARRHRRAGSTRRARVGEEESIARPGA